SESGESFIPINTQYKNAPRVEEWFHVMDGEAGDGVQLSGVVSMYNGSGKLLTSTRITVPDGGRVDIPVHSPFQEKVRSGVARFVPDRGVASEQYYIAASRLFPTCKGNAACNSYAAGYAVSISEALVSFEAVGSGSQTRGERSVVEFYNVSSKRIRSALRVS